MPTETFNLGPVTVGDKTVSAVFTLETTESPPPPPDPAPAVVGGAPDRLPVLIYNSATLVDISEGAAWDSLGSVRMTCAAMTKNLEASWAPGTGNGGRYSGAAWSDGTWALYSGCKTEGAGQDFYAHPTDAEANVLAHWQAETGGADYVAVRYLGSVIRKGGAILPFDQIGDDFLLRTQVKDYTGTGIGTVATLIPTTVPLGRKVIGKYRASANQASSWVVLFTCPDESDAAPATTGPATMGGSAGIRFNCSFETRTNTNGQVRARGNVATIGLDLYTYGWTDPALSGRYP